MEGLGIRPPPNNKLENCLKEWGLALLLMIEILHDLKYPKLWELWYLPYYGVMQDEYHQPYDVVYILSIWRSCSCTLNKTTGGEFRVYRASIRLL